jgi:hypothetical protein
MGYALDLLEEKETYPKSFINEIYNPVLMGAGGFGMMSFSNFLMRKPLIAGKIEKINIMLFSPSVD